MSKHLEITVLPDRNFVAGYPKNPATYIATRDDGHYFEAFVEEYATKADFIRAAEQHLDY